MRSMPAEGPGGGEGAVGSPSAGHPPGLDHLRDVHRRSLADPDGFWTEQSRELQFGERVGPAFEPREEPPYGHWFCRWTTNLNLNCLDRWVAAGRGEQPALVWEGEPGDRRELSYSQLIHSVRALASTLRRWGVERGDRVTIYLPMVPEAIIAMLAVTRLGAIHSVVFGGFAAPALAERINDSRSRVLITADGGWRRGRVVPLKDIADAALAQAPTVERTLVVRRTREEVNMEPRRDVWYDDEVREERSPVDPVLVLGPETSFILYTSGTTGRPKGAMHSTAGYMVGVDYSTRAVFGLGARDRFWCTADVGWVTGHSYVAYGPLLRGSTSVMYEGAPDHPSWDRWWEIIERHRVTVLYTSPTAIRGFVKQGEAIPRRHDRGSLRLLGSVGEPISPEVWKWYGRVVGDDRLPIVDTWWQTETGSILVSPQPALAEIALKPGSATVPLAGADVVVVDEHGAPTAPEARGLVVIRRPWPSQFVGLWGEESRFRETYFSRFPGWYYPADAGRMDADGYLWFLGRADEVMKVAGHRLATAEVESALSSHPAVAESAVIGRSDELRGEVPVACVVLRPGFRGSPKLRLELQEQVRRELGAIAVPAEVYFVDRVPKTRSAKIMRRLIRDVVEGRPIGDTTTLEDESSLEEARRAYAELQAEIANRPEGS